MTAENGRPQLPFPPGRTVLELPPGYRELLERGGVGKVRTPAGDEAWLVVRYEHVRALLADQRLGRSHPAPAAAAKISASAVMGGPMGDHGSERDAHQRMRRPVAAAFSARRMDLLRPRVRQHADELVARLAGLPRPLNLHDELSFQLPTLVICELLGVPYGDRERFRIWSRDLANLRDPERAQRAMTEFTGYMRQLAEHKRSEPADDLISDLVVAQRESGLTNDEVATIATLLLFAGHEPTTIRIDHGVIFLLTHPEQLAKLLADPAGWPAAVEEILRMSGSHGIPRYAQEDIDIDGVRIAAGDAVLLATGVAGRDSAIYEHPNDFDATRGPRPIPHLAFGHGAHHCVGASLARIELQEVLPALFRRLSGLRLAVPLEEIQPRGDRITGGIEALPVTW